MHRAVRRGAFVLAGVLAGCGLAEVLARFAAPIPAEELLFGAPLAAPRDLYTPHPELHMLPTVGFAGEIAALGYRVPLRINSVGTRGPEPGPGPKWLAIGDSFTMGVQVPEEAHFTTKLGAALGVEVLNAGVDGYSTWQAAGRYRGFQIELESVLLGFFLGNDLKDNADYRPLLSPRPAPAGGSATHHAGPMGRPPAMSRPVRWLFAHSVGFAWTRVAWRRWVASEAPEAERFREELGIFTRAGSAQLAELLPPTGQALTELRDAARARGDRLLVAVMPPAFAVSEERAEGTLAAFGLAEPDVDAPRRAVLEMATRLDVETCDLTDALRAGGSAMYLRFDGHLSEAGHAVAAETIAACAAR